MEQSDATAPAATTETEKTRAPRSAPRSRSGRAGIAYPVGRVGKQMHSATRGRISGIAPVLTAAIGQCFMDLLVDACLVQATKMRPNTTRLNARDCRLGLAERSIKELVGSHCIPGAGFVPSVHVESFRKADKKARRKSAKSAAAAAEEAEDK
jgi:hypothetical protein